jgi:hypothetical protein
MHEILPLCSGLMSWEDWKTLLKQFSWALVNYNKLISKVNLRIALKQFVSETSKHEYNITFYAITLISAHLF